VILFKPSRIFPPLLQKDVLRFLSIDFCDHLSLIEAEFFQIRICVEEEDAGGPTVVT